MLLRVYSDANKATLTTGVNGVANTYAGSISGVSYTWPGSGTPAATAGALSPSGLLVTGSLSKYTAEKNR